MISIIVGGGDLIVRWFTEKSLGASFAISSSFGGVHWDSKVDIEKQLKGPDPPIRVSFIETVLLAACLESHGTYMAPGCI